MFVGARLLLHLDMRVVRRCLGSVMNSGAVLLFILKKPKVFIYFRSPYLAYCHEEICLAEITKFKIYIEGLSSNEIGPVDTEKG